MYRYIQKTLDWGVKLASLAVTGPATWIVASQLFSDVTSPVLFFLMRFAAVFLIEGVLLSNWLLLEFDRNATPEIKARYGITALAMYISLLVIAWEHEGPTGLVFRVALLAALIGSGWDTYVYTWQRATSKVDRSAENSRRVKRHARKLSITEAMMRRRSEHDAEVALIDAQRSAALEQTSLYGQRLIAQIHLEDKAEMIDLSEADQRLEARTLGSGNGVNGSSNGKKKLESLPLPQVSEPADLESLSSIDNYDQEDQLLIHSILDAFEEDPSYTRRAMAQKLGVSSNKLSKLVRELIDDGLLYTEGRNVYLSDQASARARGRRVAAAIRSGRNGR